MSKCIKCSKYTNYGITCVNCSREKDTLWDEISFKEQLEMVVKDVDKEEDLD